MFELLSAGYKTERGFMKKGEIYEGIIEKVEFPNKGFVWVDDQKVIVKNGIPGQKVRFMINKKRSGRAEGRLLDAAHALQNLKALDFTMDAADHQRIDEVSRKFCSEMPEYQLFFDTKIKGE